MEQITFEGTVPDTFSNQSEFRIKIAEKDINRVIAFIEKQIQPIEQADSR